MGLIERFWRSRAGRRAGTRRSASPRERRARQRTEQAEAKLLETEARIHQEADRIRRDPRLSA